MHKRPRSEDAVPDDTFVFFWRETEIEGHFSQWWAKDPFKEGGVVYPTAEHYMMMEKARLFGDLDAQKKLTKTKSPRTAKRIGRKVKNFSDDAWNAAKNDIVYRASLAKFQSSPVLQQLLLSTGTATICEASPFDRVWGIGLRATHRNARSPEKWPGENLLGLALMRVRKILRQAPPGSKAEET